MSLSKVEINTSSFKDIVAHLVRCNNSFKPELSTYVDIPEYSKKLSEYSERYEVWDNDKLIALLAFYHKESTIYISNLSVEKDYQGAGIASTLLNTLKNTLLNDEMDSIELEVYKENIIAKAFYERHGFEVVSSLNNKLTLILKTNV